MTPKEKYLEEKDELKTSRMNRIMEAGFQLFSEKGIDNIAMTDIAKKAEIGVASLYRYYETKDEIAIRTAIWIWNIEREKMIPKVTSEEFNNKTGLEQLEVIFNLFINLYSTEQSFLRFVYFFDSFVIRTGISPERLMDYESLIVQTQQITEKAIKKGIMDKTIKSEYEGNEDTLYFALMHSFFSTCQKICLSGSMLVMDTTILGTTELKALSKILLEGIKN